MKLEIPKDLINKTDREIKEMISTIGLVNFSRFLSIYLEDSKNLDQLKNNQIALEKVAMALDAVLMYYQMSRNNPENKIDKFPLNNDLINKFMDIYSLFSKEEYGNCK